MEITIKIEENIFVLNNANIHIFDKNINIIFDINKLFVNYLHTYNKNKTISDKMYIFLEDSLIIVKNFIFIENKIKDKMRLILVSENIFNYTNSLKYLRNEKLKKIIYNTNEESI